MSEMSQRFAGLDSVLLAALEQTRAATCVTTAEVDWPGPEIVYVNPAYCDMVGWPRDDVLGQTPRIMQGPLTNRTVLDRLRRALETGESFSGETVNYRKDGTPFFISWSVDPVFDGDGSVTYFIATQQDVTRLRRAESQLGAQLHIDRAMSELITAAAAGDLDPANLSTEAGAIIGGAVVTLVGAGAAAVTIVDDDEMVRVETGDTAHTDEFFDRVMQQTASSRAIRRGVEDDVHWISTSVVDSDGDRIGQIVVTNLDEHQAAFVDEAGLSTVSRFAATAIRSVGEYARQRRTAVKLQRALMPNPAAHPALDIAFRYEPGADDTLVGGDWYDCIETAAGPTLVVGDVVGSGIDAAATMGRLQLLLRGMLEMTADPCDAVAIVDGICATEALFATVVVVSVDVETGSVVTVCAGHPPPLLHGPDGTRFVDVEPSPPLGTGTSSKPTARTTDLGASTMVLYTDGAFERRDEDVRTGLDRLLAVVADAPTDPEALCDAVTGVDLVGGADDAVLFAFRLDRHR